MTVVRFVELEPGAGLPSELAGLRLGAAELARRDRLAVPADRLAYEAAHLLVRVCAGALLGVDPAGLRLEQRCDGCGGTDHGAPRIVGDAGADVADGDGGAAGPRAHVSLSHTRGAVAAIAAHRPCGIDVELLREQAIPRGALTAGEAEWVAVQPVPGEAFLSLWTRKECLVKTGLARLDALHLVDARTPPAGASFGDWRGGSALGAWCVRG